MISEKEYGILFTGPNVLSILDDKKTCTRRIANPQPSFGMLDDETEADYEAVYMDDGSWEFLLKRDHGMGVSDWNQKCKYGTPGDKLWVRETFKYDDTFKGGGIARQGIVYGEGVIWRATAPLSEQAGPWKPSIFMPRWACRLMLEVLEVRIERVQDITSEGAIAEGVVEWGSKEMERRNFDENGKRRRIPLGPDVFDGSRRNLPYLVNAFADLWDSLNLKRGPKEDRGLFSWDRNPWVWVINFKRIKEA